MERVIVASDIPADLVKRMDIYLAELRLTLIKSGAAEVRLPTRSSFIRDAILAKLNHHGNGTKK